MNNNFKVRAVEGCDLRSGFSLLNGCVPHPFKTDDTNSIVDGSASNVKIAFTELSELQDVKEIMDYKTSLFGVALVDKPISLSIESTDFKYKRSWVLTDLRTMNKKSYRSTRNLELTDAAMELLENDPKKFMNRYGEMYVNGYITGAEFNGYMTVATDKEEIFEEMQSRFGSQPTEADVQYFQSTYPRDVKIEVEV